MQGARGDGKRPGEIRDKPNWVGGATLQSAIFVPPHPEFVPRLLSDLESLWHNRSISMPKLIRIAITHYQFETIHPYADGNGRMGRLLIMLQMINYGFMDKPTLYMSDFFEKHRQNYYNALVEGENKYVHGSVRRAEVECDQAYPYPECSMVNTMNQIIM